MTRRHAFGWVLAVALSMPSGGLIAGPADCLSYRADADVASCANRYASGSLATPKQSATMSTSPRALQVQAGDSSDLKTVPVVPASAKVESAPEPKKPTFAVDRQVLTNTIIAGAIGGSVLILVALGLWRWGSTLTKACPWCGTKVGRNARACRHCFRAV